MIVKIYNWTKKIVAILGTSLIGLMLSTGVNAEVEPVEVRVEFVAPIAITEVTPLEFGLVDLNMVSPETIVIAIDGGVTDAGLNILGGATPTAATFTTQMAATKAITIQVTSPSPGTYYTLGTWRCDYNSLNEGDCLAGIQVTSAAGPVVPIRLGVTLTSTGPALAVTDYGGFDLTITYD